MIDEDDVEVVDCFVVHDEVAVGEALDVDVTDGEFDTVKNILFDIRAEFVAVFVEVVVFVDLDEADEDIESSIDSVCISDGIEDDVIIYEGLGKSVGLLVYVDLNERVDDAEGRTIGNTL